MALQAFQVPQFDLSTTSTTSWDLINANNQSQVLNLMPYAGTVKRVLIGHNSDLGSGHVAVRRVPNGHGSSIPGLDIPYVGNPSPFTEKIDVNVAFEKDDGLLVEFLGDAITTVTLFVTLEIEFDLA